MRNGTTAFRGDSSDPWSSVSCGITQCSRGRPFCLLPPTSCLAIGLPQAALTGSASTRCIVFREALTFFQRSGQTHDEIDRILRPVLAALGGDSSHVRDSLAGADPCAAAGCASAGSGWTGAARPGRPRRRNVVVDVAGGRRLFAQAADQGRARRKKRPRPSCCRPAIAWSSSSPKPQVISPAVVRFDGNGRMYVAEFVTYMRDADGNNQHAPESRITRFESTKGDGVYDKRTVFVDKLVLPRTVLPLDDNSILTNETASDDVVKYTDTNNDGVADKREHCVLGHRPRPRRQPRARAEPASSGASTTGSTAPTTRSASAGRRPASSRSRPARTAASGA